LFWIWYRVVFVYGLVQVLKLASVANELGLVGCKGGDARRVVAKGEHPQLRSRSKHVKGQLEALYKAARRDGFFHVMCPKPAALYRVYNTQDDTL
jgi:hypothetical protein